MIIVGGSLVEWSGDGDSLIGPLVPVGHIWPFSQCNFYLILKEILTTHDTLWTFGPILICTSSTRPFS